MKTQDLVLGSCYTRQEIWDAVGGGNMDSYLPHKGGRVLAGCFRTDLNERAPEEVVVGNGPQIIASARILDSTKAEIPVFLKRGTNQWEYKGIYRCLRYSKSANSIQPNKANRKDAAGVLYFEPISDSPVKSLPPVQAPLVKSPKVARIAFNSSGWTKPTGDARKHEAKGTYNHVNGFGHEDWLFRSEWLIDGWRYVFIQGVNKSRAKLVKEGQPVDLTLFTIEPDKRRSYVATIRAVECLNEQQASDALLEFKRRGWFAQMEREIKDSGGDASALLASKTGLHVLNARFRLDNVSFFATGTYATEDDPVQRLQRYMLYGNGDTRLSPKSKVKKARPGSPEMPIARTFTRGPTAPVECAPEHVRMQAKLMEELRSEFPNAEVRREQDFIDVSVRTATELRLYEIKSDLEPRTVIRQALGQILEYAFHPSRDHTLPLKLILVGRRALSPDDKNYLSRLQNDFSLPVEYRVVSI